MKQLYKTIHLHLVAIAVFASTGIGAQVLFEDVSEQTGLNYAGKSFGSSWADINGDGRLDLFMSCHFNYGMSLYENAVPHIFMQNSDGTFQATQLSFLPQSDLHGGAFFDFDRDGDMDLLNLTGGAHINVFLENNGNFAVANKAVEYGLDRPTGRGRMVTLIDVNRDGYLDVIINNQSGLNNAPTALYLNKKGNGFQDISQLTNFPQNDAEATMLGKFTHTKLQEILMFGKQTAGIYRVGSSGFTEVYNFQHPNLTDAAIGDFTGNLHEDVYFARGIQSVSQSRLKNDTLFRGIYFLHPSHTPEVEIRFVSEGNLYAKITPRRKNQLYAINPGSNEPSISNELQEISLDLNDANLSDMVVADELNANYGHWNIHREGNQWVLKGIAPQDLQWTVALEIHSDAPITDIVTTGLPGPNTAPYRDIFYFNNGSGGFDLSAFGSPDDPINAFSVVAADFDNDMDLDLFVVTAGEAGNMSNYILENDGQGNFTRHEGAWGAGGTEEGVGESVSLVDFDNDGFMDLFVTNGQSIFFLEGAPAQLFRNLGNENNWLKLNLKGVQSNLPGIGATAICFAGGKQQLRVQDGGIHSRTQNDDRIHFGLGPNTHVDSLYIFWPNGRLQKHFNVPSNQILTVIEPDPQGYIRYEDDFNVWIYPQPSTGKVFIESNEVTPLQMALYNTLGQLIHLPNTVVPGQILQFELDSGVYFLKISRENKATTTRKIIIQR